MRFVRQRGPLHRQNNILAGLYHSMIVATITVVGRGLLLKRLTGTRSGTESAA
jgi:hypothetical protein